jgi:hypothetical protein
MKTVTDGPMINVDEFRHRPVNELAALLPDKQAAEAAINDLQTANIDISTVRVPVDSCQLARFVGVVDSSEDARFAGVLSILVLDR